MAEWRQVDLEEIIEEYDDNEVIHDVMMDISVVMHERGLTIEEQKAVLRLKLYYLDLAEDDVCGDSA